MGGEGNLWVGRVGGHSPENCQVHSKSLNLTVLRQNPSVDLIIEKTVHSSHVI